MKRLLLALGIVALSTSASRAASYTWNVGSGDWSEGANWSPAAPSGGPGASDSATVNSGTVTISADTTVSDFNFGIGAVRQGGATLTVTNVMNWTGGYLFGGGRTIIGTNGTLNMHDPSQLRMTSHVLDNAGTVFWTDTGTFSLDSGAEFTNRPGAFFIVQNNATIGNGGGSAPRFDNAGTFRRPVGVGNGTTVVGIAFNNYGLAEVQSGTLLFSALCNNFHTMMLAGGTTNRLAGGGSSSGNFEASPGALVDFTAGSTFTLNAGAQLNGPGLYRIGSGVTLNVNTDVAVFNLDFNNGLLQSAATLTILQVLNWPAGTISGYGRTVIAPGAIANLGGPAYLEVRGSPGLTLENGGKVILSGSSLHMSTSSILTNRTEGIIELHSSADITSTGGTGPPGQFDNAGTFSRHSNAGNGTTVVGIPFNNFGTLNIPRGIVAANGGYSSGPRAVLDLAIGGTTPGTGFGQLQAGGIAGLDGALNLSLANGFVPAVGNEFLVVSSATRSGGFSSISGLDLGGGVRLALSYPGQGAVLTTVQLGLTPATLPNGFVGRPYAQALSGVNGVGPYSFALSGLPAEFTLSGGMLSGTPSAAGVFNFTVQVTDLGAAGHPSVVVDRSLRVLSCGLAEGLVSLWHGDVDARDSIGTNHGMFENGGTFVSGKIGPAFSFDGVDDYVSVPDSTAWDFEQSDFSIQCWVKLAQLQNSMFLHQQSGGTPGGFEWRYDHSISGLMFSRDGAVASILRPWTPQAGRWYHLALTRNNSAYRLYVDGQQLGGEELDASPVANVTGNLRIGGYVLGGWQLAGQMDEVSIYRRGLSANEIATIYNNGNGGDCLDRPEFLTIPTLAEGWVSTPYWQRLSATFGHAPLTFALGSGALPSGLEMSPSGLIHGTPLMAGTSGFTVTATDTLGATAQRQFTIVVNSQLPCVTVDPAWARWPSEGNGVETVNGFDGSLFNGPTFTPGVVGQAFLFDGVDDCFQASVPYLPTRNRGEASYKNCTLELWLRRDGPAPEGGFWVAGWGEFHTSYWAEFGILVDGSQRITISLDNNSIAPGPVTELGRWYHVAAVYEDGFAKLYVDGVLVGNVASAFGVDPGPVNIGRFPTAGNPGNRLPFKGAVDEPTIFIRALSAAEVRSIYEAGGSGKCRSLNITVPNSTFEVIAHTTNGPNDAFGIRVRGLAFGPQNEPIAAWIDAQQPDGGLMWAARTSGSWGTPHRIQHAGIETIGWEQGFALRDDGVPFFMYGVRNIYVGDDNYVLGIYLVNGLSEPDGPGSLIYNTGIDLPGGTSALAFSPGTELPDYVSLWGLSDNSMGSIYDGIAENLSGRLLVDDFAINTNGVHALFYVDGGSSVKMSRTPGIIDGPAIGSLFVQVAGSVNGSGVFHALLSDAAASRSGKMAYARSTDGTNWVLTDLGPGVDFRRSRAVGLAINPMTDQPALAYYRVGKLWYAELIDGHWVQTAVGSFSGYSEETQPASGTEIFRLAFDREGKPAIAIFDPGTTNLLLYRLAPPTIVQQPQPVSQTVCPGASVTYTVQASDAALSYQWRKNGEPLGGFVNHPNFTIVNVQPGDAGSYDVIVRNLGNSATSSVAMLTVRTETVDTDGDGMPDCWELAHGLNHLDASDADADADGDGSKNVGEFIAGTDPQDSASRLALEKPVLSAAALQFRFERKAGKSYSVVCKNTLDDNPWIKVQDIEAGLGGGMETIVVPTLGFGTRFYTVVTPKLP